jgi:DNA-binding response OmpR family regulator
MGNEKRQRECAVAKILIVDDDPDIVEAGRLVLEREGYVMMEEPDDGLRMAREIRKAGHTLPIIMLTSVNAAMGLNIDKDEEMVPVDEFQPKPVDPQTLIAKVKKLLS